MFLTMRTTCSRVPHCVQCVAIACIARRCDVNEGRREGEEGDRNVEGTTCKKNYVLATENNTPT